MDENSTKINLAYPPALREKAITLLKQGLSKNRISKELGISFTTIRRWTAGEPSPYSIQYSAETKQKALELAKEKISRAKISEDLGVGYYTVLAWTRGIGTWQKRFPFSPKLKRKARQFIRAGLSKRETAARLNISYNTLCEWTSNLHTANSRLTGAAERILAEIIEKGYFTPKPAQLNICRGLKQNLGLKLIKQKGIWICYSARSTNEALQHLLDIKKINYTSATKLRRIQNTLYARN